MDNKKRLVISFDEGCSGNFLAALLTNSKLEKFNRIDHPWNVLYYQGLPTAEDFKLLNSRQHTIITHESDSNVLKELSPDIVIRILPITGMFTAIYNVFSKKHLANTNIPAKWPSDPGYCYDMTLEHIKDYFNIFSNLKSYPGQLIFDFGWLYDTDKLLKFTNSLGIPIDISLVDQYIDNQLDLLLDLPTSSLMQDIIEEIPDSYFEKSPWFACYAIFCFETVNKLNESQRLWNIDNLTLLDKNQLINLSNKYL